MLEQSVYFLSGLPRTGSTLLGSILAQNPDFYVTPTSPLYSLLAGTSETFRIIDNQYTYDQVNISKRIYHAIVDEFYKDVKQPVIFDKHRGWPKHIEAIREYINPNPRLICTIRPIAEIITSYLVLADQDENNFIDKHLKALGQEITNEARAHLLWTNYLNTPYEIMVESLKTHRENLLLVDYRDIVFSPEKTLNKVYEFCGLEPFKHTPKDIENKCAESKDEAWGLKNLHTIRPELSMQSADPKAYLPKEAIEYFNQFDIGA